MQRLGPGQAQAGGDENPTGHPHRRPAPATDVMTGPTMASVTSGARLPLGPRPRRAERGAAFGDNGLDQSHRQSTHADSVPLVVDRFNYILI